MFQFSNVVFLSALMSLSSSPAWASKPASHHLITQQWLVDLNHGSGNVEFHATGRPSAIKIVGKGSAPQGDLKVVHHVVSGSVTFDLESLDTGISLRTKHMKEKYLETGKYREAKLTITQMPLSQDLSGPDFTADQVHFTGTLSLHGVERPVAGIAKVQKNGNHVSVAANFGLKVSDYQIPVPKFAGITMADDVEVSVTDTAPITLKN